MGIGRNLQTLRIADLDLTDDVSLGYAVRRLAETGSQKSHLEREYLTNLDFLEGGAKAWNAWTESGGRELDARIKEDAMLITFNLILVQAETIAARLMRPEPVWGALPIPGSERNVVAARMAEQVLNYVYTRGLQMPLKLTQFLITTMCSPLTFLTGGWDYYRGKVVSTTFNEFLQKRIKEEFPDQQQIEPQALKRVTDESSVMFKEIFGEDAGKGGKVVQRTGALFAEVVSVLDAYWYPWDAQCWEEVEFFVWRKNKTVSSLADELQMEPNDIRSYRSRGSANVGAGVTSSGNFGRPGGRSTSRELEADTIDCHYAWHRQSTKYPEGVQGLVLGNNGSAISNGPIDNKPMIIPMFPLVQHFIPEKMEGTCLVSQTRSIALDINKAASQDSSYVDSMIWPTMIMSEAGAVDGETQEPSNSPAEIITVTSMTEKPEFMERPSIPLDNTRRIDRNISFMREAASVAAIQVGNSKDANVKSGRAIDALSESTNERLATFGRALNKNQEDFAEFMLQELQTKPVGEQFMLLNGTDNQLEAISFVKEDLIPDVVDGGRTAAVQVTAFSEMRMPRMLNTQYTLQIVKSGILRPGVDDAKIWKMLGSGDSQMFADQTRKDRAHQTREIRLWRQGIITPSPFEDEHHDAQAECIVEWKRGGEYRQTIKDFPWMAPHIDKHLRDHRRLKMMEQMKLVLLERRVRMEAWMATLRDIEFDAQTGDQDAQRVFAMQQILFPIEIAFADPALSMMGLGQSEAERHAAIGSRPPPPGKGGAGGQQQGGNPQQPNQQGAKLPMDSTTRAQHKDRADSGVPRQDILI